MSFRIQVLNTPSFNRYRPKKTLNSGVKPKKFDSRGIFSKKNLVERKKVLPLHSLKRKVPHKGDLGE